MIAPQPVVSPALVRWCRECASPVTAVGSHHDPRWREWRIGMGLGVEPPVLVAQRLEREARLAAIDARREEIRARQQHNLAAGRAIHMAQLRQKRAARKPPLAQRYGAPGVGYSGLKSSEIQVAG